MVLPHGLWNFTWISVRKQKAKGFIMNIKSKPEVFHDLEFYDSTFLFVNIF